MQTGDVPAVLITYVKAPQSTTSSFSIKIEDTVVTVPRVETLYSFI